MHRASSLDLGFAHAMSTSRSELTSTTLSLVSSFDPGSDGRAIESRERTMQLLQGVANPFSRKSVSPGHMTASAVVLSPDKTKTLLVFHERLDRWLQPGGHVEPDDIDLADTARREVLEETSIGLERVKHVLLVGIDVHAIPAANGEPSHLHHDLTFCYALDGDQLPEITDRPYAVWCTLDRLHAYHIDSAFQRSLQRALQHHGCL